MSDFLHELAQVHWGYVVLFAIWILPVPKLVELNLDALIEAKVDAPLWFLKIVVVVFGFGWPLLILRAIVKRILTSIFPSLK